MEGGGQRSGAWWLCVLSFALDVFNFDDNQSWWRLLPFYYPLLSRSTQRIMAGMELPESFICISGAVDVGKSKAPFLTLQLQPRH
jgi:hypothetical protein